MPLPLEITFVINLAAFISVYVILTLGLNLQYGLTGIPNFGPVLGVAAGAYTVGALSGRIAQWYFNVMPGQDFNSQNVQIMVAVNAKLAHAPIPGFEIMAIVLVIGAVVGAAIGGLSYLPTMRLRGDYLGISLFAFGETAQYVGDRYQPLVNGAIGVTVIDPFTFLGTLRFPVVTALIVITAIAIFLYVRRLETSPLGRALRAVRDDELTSEVLGKNASNIRLRTMIIGTTIFALCGGLWAFYTANVTASGYTRVDWTFWPWLILLVGGLGNSKGVVAGAAAIIVTRSAINLTKNFLGPFVPFDPSWIEYLVFGAALAVILVRRTKGIVPERPGSTIDRDFKASTSAKSAAANLHSGTKTAAHTNLARIRRFNRECAALLKRARGFGERR